MSRIKVCTNPHCDAVWHNVPKKATHCRDCDARIIEINQDTYSKKFASRWFQYNYPTHSLIPTSQRGKAVQGDLTGQ